MAETTQRFPPIDWLWREYEINSAWYSGDPSQLVKLPADESKRFWKSTEEIKVHLPIAADIVAISAGMIFSESPKITAEDERTQERIDEITEANAFYSVLLQAAELAGVFGGVFLKWTWDSTVDTFPRLFAVPVDCGLPVWRGGKLIAVKLWSIVRKDEDTGTVWRTEEIYTDDGHIRTRLLKGDDSNLGSAVPLDSIDETRGMMEDVQSGTGMLLATYIPNMLPNRKHPHVRFGRSDFDGLYGLFDALDEAYSALQRETRLTKTTVIVPAEYLRKRDAIFGLENPACKATQWVYSNDSGVFTALDIDSDRTSNPVTVINPEIRAEQRLALCDDLIRRIWSAAGYSPQSAGIDISGSAESGTALNVRERRTIRTTEVKKTHWWHALHDIVRAMLALDAAVFRSGVKPDADITIELPSNTQPDISQMAEILEQLERAGALSTETKVELLHPDWDEERRAEEVERIKIEKGMIGPDPLDAELGDTEAPVPEEDDA